MEEAVLRLQEAEKIVREATPDSDTIGAMTTVCYLKGYIQGFCEGRGEEVRNYLPENN